MIKRFFGILMALLLTMNFGCEKSTFEEYPLPDGPYSERVPFGFSEVRYSSLGWLDIDWALDEEYLEEFYPGYSFNLYAIDETFIASLENEEPPLLIYVVNLGVYSNTKLYANIIDANGNEVFRSEDLESD